MTGRPPFWRTLDELLTLLRLERNALDAQIAAVEAARDSQTPAGRADILVLRYLESHDAAIAARYATDLGWLLASSNRGTPSTRQYTAKDVLAFARGASPEVSPDVLELCRRLGVR
jgi:hypothetical protein